MISIIIPSYFSRATIGQCLRSLEAQRTDEPYDILVINSSDDDTSKIVTEQFPTVRCTQLKERVYAGTARNIGIQETQGNILAFIDADCTAAPTWLHKIATWHQKGYRIVGGSIVNKSQANIFSKAEYPLEILKFSPNNPRGEVKFISAANCSISREVFEEYGSFPEIRAGEDLVFSRRIVEKSEKIMFDPEIKVFHENDVNFERYLRKQLMHGQYSYVARQMAKLTGSFLNHPLAFPFFLPLLPFIRAIGPVYSSLALKNKLIYDIISTFPLFFLGCLMWSFGYTKGFIEHRLSKKK